ncbi:MAG: FecR family protein [Saprospiraceae bacterium]
MNQFNFSVESLAADDSFQKYCLAPEPKDVEYWDNWLAKNQEHRTTFIAAKEIVNNLSFQLSRGEVQAEFDLFQKNISLQEDKISPTIKSHRTIPTWIFRVAAVFLVAIMAWGIWQWQTPNLSEIVTEFGETNSFQLSDGSEVVLNANSKIKFSENWNSTEMREVWLNGEAFFEIKHAANQPFIVHTQKGDVEVLGTEFNVMQRSDDFNVTLVSGKVHLELPNKTKINLQPNDQFQIHDKTISHTQVDVESVTAWRYDKMVFKNASIENIISRLENDFGWQIKLNNQEILKRKINASIPENNPDLLLEALSAIYDLKIKKIGEKDYVIE